MSGPIIRGTNQSLVREEYSYTRENGFSLVREWEGDRAAMNTLVNSLAQGGVSVTQTHDGAVVRVQAQYGSWSWGMAGGSPEFPTEDWEVSTEIIDKEIWTLPDVVADMTFHTSTSTVGGITGAGVSVQKYKRIMTDAANDDTAEEDNEDLQKILQTDTAVELLSQLTSNVTHYPVETAVVRRIRQASTNYYWARTIYKSVYVYTPSQLAFPGEIVESFEMPEPEWNTLSGFRIRTQNMQISSDRRIETVEWILARWSTLLYEMAPSGIYT